MLPVSENIVMSLFFSMVFWIICQTLEKGIEALMMGVPVWMQEKKIWVVPLVFLIVAGGFFTANIVYLVGLGYGMSGYAIVLALVVIKVLIFYVKAEKPQITHLQRKRDIYIAFILALILFPLPAGLIQWPDRISRFTLFTYVAFVFTVKTYAVVDYVLTSLKGSKK